MRSGVGSIAIFLVLTAALPAFSDDQQKTEKQVNQLTAMATDPTGRRMVSIAMSDLLRVPRPQLVRERRAMNLNYGSLFLAHELTAGGVKMLDIALQLQAGKNILQIANGQHADWKQIAADAKMLNRRIDGNLYSHFVNRKHDDERDQADRYEVASDGVPSDNSVSEREVDDARTRYLLWRDRAANGAERDGRLGIADELAARMDHAGSGGPTTRGLEGGAAPAAGGLPTK
jgi:hypothetical protein